MTELLMIVLLFYVGLNLFGILAFLFNPSEVEWGFDPKTVYRESEYNWFGTILVVVLFHIIFLGIVPFYYFYKLMTYGKD